MINLPPFEDLTTKIIHICPSTIGLTLDKKMHLNIDEFDKPNYMTCVTPCTIHTYIHA